MIKKRLGNTPFYKTPFFRNLSVEDGLALKMEIEVLIYE
jgi:hypothetical protein